MTSPSDLVKRPLVDEACFELAEHFLPNGTPDQLWSLADDIQRAVEDWFDGDQERGGGT